MKHTKPAFSKNRFGQLSNISQHKKCGELVRAYIEMLQEHEKDFSLISHIKEEYINWCSWMNIEALQDWSFEALEERYHYHIRLSERGLQEYDFPYATLEQQDGNRICADWLNVTTYLDGLRSCHNIGSIVRTVEALRLGNIVFSEDMAKINHPQIIKTSMGAFSHVFIDQVTERELEKILPRPWIAIETIEESYAYQEYTEYTAPMTLFFGNEVRGIRNNLLKKCDIIIHVPLYGFKNSLNVANCHAIIASYIAAQLRIKS